MYFILVLVVNREYKILIPIEGIKMHFSEVANYKTVINVKIIQNKLLSPNNFSKFRYKSFAFIEFGTKSSRKSG